MSDDEKKLFSDLIKKSREDLDITQEDLSNKLGVTSRTIARWEAGESIPPDSKQEQIKNSLYLLLKAKSSGVSSSGLAGLMLGSIMGGGLIAGTALLAREIYNQKNAEEEIDKLLENTKEKKTLISSISTMRNEIKNIKDKINILDEMLDRIEESL